MPHRLVRIITNPVSGDGLNWPFLNGLVRHLTLRRFTVEVHQTQGPGHAERLARETPADARCVVSVGGDGTHSEVFAGLAGRAVPACIVPSGTENVLASAFRMTGTLRETVGLVQSGRPVPIDVAVANDRPFVIFSGIGFDAAVTRAVHARRHGPIARSAYYGPIVRTLVRYPFPALRVVVDGREVASDVGFALVGNVPLYCDGLRVAARALADDGLLDVVCYRATSWVRFGILFALTKVGRHLGRPDVAYARGRRIQVTADLQVPVQVDGDARLNTPVTYTLRPRAARLLLPSRGNG